jgi:hypothetical protein
MKIPFFFFENGRITRHLSCVLDEMRDVVSAAVPRNFSFLFFWRYFEGA